METRTQIYSMWRQCSPARDSWLPEQWENKPVLLEAICSSSNRKPIPISHVIRLFSLLNIPMTGVEKRCSKRSFLLLLVSVVLKVLICPLQSPQPLCSGRSSGTPMPSRALLLNGGTDARPSSELMDSSCRWRKETDAWTMSLSSSCYKKWLQQASLHYKE